MHGQGQKWGFNADEVEGGQFQDEFDILLDIFRPQID